MYARSNWNKFDLCVHDGVKDSERRSLDFENAKIILVYKRGGWEISFWFAELSTLYNLGNQNTGSQVSKKILVGKGKSFGKRISSQNL